MEDSKWQESAEQWELAYRMVKQDRDALELRLRKICETGKSIGRGCDCEYDYRCGNCSRILALLELL